MTMYLPNPDLHATGYEPGEFIEVPDTSSDVGPAEPGAPRPRSAPEPAGGPAVVARPSPGRPPDG